jgi:hypothetical protein
MAARLGFSRFQIWLISNEGFSEEQQADGATQSVWLESSTTRTAVVAPGRKRLAATLFKPPDPDEFLMVVPMGEDNELIAANTAEQIAKRLTFPSGSD